MSVFPARWLTMREPYDHAARDPGLVARLDEAVGERAIALCDLGCGLGSNLRFVAPRLRAAQRWILVDSDPDLLAAIPEVLSRWAHQRGEACVTTADGLQIGDRLEVEWLRADLRTLDWPQVDVLTTQALLDLVSRDWLARLADELAHQVVPLLAALSVDGTLAWTPPDPHDDPVHAAFRAHQHTDRGFGASPGTEATRELRAMLEDRRFTVETAQADWQIGADDPAMLAEMLTGIAGAAAEMEPDPARVLQWADRRRARIAAGGSGLEVGHLDLLALPIHPR